MVDENIHIDKTTQNQVLLTCSRKHPRGELGEPMGNTANFEGAVLYASQSTLAISGGLKKTAG